MTLLHRGLTIELPDDDPRIPVFEALLFGKSLPPPLPEPPGPPTPAAEAAPVVEVPPKVREAWASLTELDRRELRLLAEGPLGPADVEAKLGLTRLRLLGQHSRINRIAFRNRVPLDIRRSGRGRRQRRFFVRPEAVPFLRALGAEDDRRAT